MNKENAQTDPSRSPVDSAGHSNGGQLYPHPQQPVQHKVDPNSQDQGHYHYTHESTEVAGGPVGKLKAIRNKHKSIWSFVELFALAIFIALIISRFIFHSYVVQGLSMESTLQNGDRLIINRMGKTVSKITGSDFSPKRGDIIVFTSPARSDEILIKRVIGLPGDRVVVDDGLITIFNDENPQGFNPDVPYEENLPQDRTGEVDVEVGDKQFFVSGDNRAQNGSLDSRNQLGLVPEENIIGDLVLRLFPLNKASFF